MSSKSNKETLTFLDRGEYLSTTIRTQKAETTAALDGIFGVLHPRAGQTEGPRQFNWDQAQVDNMGLKLVGLDVPPVRPKLGVREQYGLIYRQMGNPALPSKLAELAQAHSAGSTPDVAGFLSVMETNIQAFEAAQASLNKAKKLRDQAYATKEAALQRLRNIVVNVSRIQEGYYRLAGFDDLADRMRLTIPKSRRSNPDNAAGDSETDPDSQAAGEGPEPATEPTSP